MLLRILLAGLALIALGSADIVKLDDGDSRISYLPSIDPHGAVCGTTESNAACNSKWWVETNTDSEGGGYHNTWGPETTLSLKTKGTKINVYGTQYKKSAVGSVSVNGTKLGNFNDKKSTDDTPQFKKQLATFDIPNPQGIENTVIIAYELDATNTLQTPASPDDRFYIGIDYIEIDEPKDDGTDTTPPNNTDSSSSSSSSQTSTSTSSTSTSTAPGTGPTADPGSNENTSDQNNAGNTPLGSDDSGNKDNTNTNSNTNTSANQDEAKGVFSTDKAKLGFVIAGSIIAGIVVLAVLWAIFKRVRRQAKVNAEISEIMDTQLNNESSFPPYRDSPSVAPVALPADTRRGPGAYGPQGGASYPFAYPPMRSQTPMAAPPLQPPSRTGTPQSFMAPGSSFYPPAPADPPYHPLLATGYVDVRSQSPAFAGAPIPPPGLPQMAYAPSRSPAPQDFGRPIHHADDPSQAYDAVTLVPPTYR
ncbi:hypothetical protein BKA62DRAFT_832073 [Auriculariales sp. MPI-PUGE-AT-0066]|nr:hypothetical protein BKA62DRAFT_832073 [Auriculariales sp. MPI-PUGE-AT-0066]